MQHPTVESRRTNPARATNSLDRLRRKPAAELSVFRAAPASVAIPVATTTFQCPTTSRTEFCALASRFCHRSSRDVAHSDRNRDLGATATHRIIELASSSIMGRCDRDIPFNGLCLLVVALGHAYGAVLLAIS